MAQLVEQLIRNQQVVGSSPISSFWADIYQVSAFFVMATRKMNACIPSLCGTIHIIVAFFCYFSAISMI